METVQIEAFTTNLHGCRVLCQGPFTNEKYAPIMDYIQKLREPFKRKVLLTQSTFSFSKYMPLQYDAIFQVKDVQDWPLVLTYMTYAPKPLLVVAEDVIIPDALWQKINRAITFIHITSSSILNIRYYDAIFFAPVEELTTSYADYIFKLLQSIYKAAYTSKEHKEILQELRVASAGICWTKHEEATPHGAIYWYDPVTTNQGEALSSKQMAELFTWLANQFKHN